MSILLVPHVLKMKILKCRVSKRLRAELFRICMNHDASYSISPDDSIKWMLSSEGSVLFDLVVEVKTIDMLKAKKIIENTKDLCALRGYVVVVQSLQPCAPFEQYWVQVSDCTSNWISPEYSPTTSVSSAKDCRISVDTQLRMIEDPTQNYIKVGLVVKEYHLAPRYKYRKFENDPMNIIYLSHSLHYPMNNSEIRVRDRGRSIAVPKLCLSLAKDEFPDQYSNKIISKEYYGRQTQMTEVFLAMLFRVIDEDYINAVLHLLKPGSLRSGTILITSVLIRHENESVDDFEDFVRENKKYSIALWRKAPADEVSMDARDEYQLQEEDYLEIEEIEAELYVVKRKRD